MRTTGRPATVRAVVVTTAVLALLAAAVWFATMDAVAQEGAPSGFRQTVDVDQRSYAEGETVAITYRVCRVLPWPTTTSSSGGTDVLTWFWVFDAEGRVVADSSHLARTLELRTVPWLPGQCRTAEWEWDQRHWNREPSGEQVLGTPAKGDRVPPGEYRAEVAWQGAPTSTEVFTISPPGS